MGPFLLPLLALAVGQPEAGPVTSTPGVAYEGPSARDIREAIARNYNNEQALMLCGDVGPSCGTYEGPDVRDVECGRITFTQASCRYLVLYSNVPAAMSCTGEFRLRNRVWWFAHKPDPLHYTGDGIDETCVEADFRFPEDPARPPQPGS